MLGLGIGGVMKAPSRRRRPLFFRCPVVERIGPPLYSLLRFACPMRSSPFLGTERGWRATERQRSGLDGHVGIRVDDPNARFTRRVIVPAIFPSLSVPDVFLHFRTDG